MRTMIINIDCFLDLLKTQNKEAHDATTSAMAKSEINWKDSETFVWEETAEFFVEVERGRQTTFEVYTCQFSYESEGEKFLYGGDHEISLEDFKEWGNRWIEKVI